MERRRTGAALPGSYIHSVSRSSKTVRAGLKNTAPRQLFINSNWINVPDCTRNTLSTLEKLFVGAINVLIWLLKSAIEFTEKDSFSYFRFLQRKLAGVTLTTSPYIDLVIGASERKRICIKLPSSVKCNFNDIILKVPGRWLALIHSKYIKFIIN